VRAGLGHECKLHAARLFREERLVRGEQALDDVSSDVARRICVLLEDRADLGGRNSRLVWAPRIVVGRSRNERKAAIDISTITAN
jgi:hypothetical protein